MKKILLALLFIPFFLNGYGATFNIVNVGITFSPATLTINEGDNVTFALNSTLHNAIEVSQATWNADGIDPLAGGFSVLYPGGSVSSTQLTLGAHYYVCTNHVTLGMKGLIIVQSTLAVPVVKAQDDMLIYPNPAKGSINVQLNIPTSNPVEIKLFNLQGKLVDVLFPKTQLSGLLIRNFQLNNLRGAGIYFVQVTSGDNSTYRKIVIE